MLADRINDNEPPGFLELYGERLIDLGYPIVPIRPGTKHPGFEGWQNTEATAAHVARWLGNGFGEGGIGVLARDFPGADMDVHSIDVVSMLVDWCERNIGPAPRRVGRAPKVLLPYRTDEPFAKIASRTYVDENGEENKVEILGDGQQYVVYAVHPDTGAPYTWVNDHGVADVPADDLTTITADQARRLVAFFEENVPQSWTPVRRGSDGRNSTGVPNDPLSNAAAPLDITVEQIERVLDALDPDMRMADWVAVGMGLYHQFTGRIEGFRLFDGWSAKGHKYNEKEMASRWRSFEVDLRVTRPRTFATAVGWAAKAGVRIAGAPAGEQDPLEVFLKRYVFIEEENKVSDLDKPPNDANSLFANWKNAVANVRHEVEVSRPLKDDPDRTVTKVQPVSASWLVHPKRKMAQGIRFDPSQPIMFERDGLTWMNAFHMPAFAPSDASTEVFWRHLDYLFPIAEEREWFADWMAFNLQRPAVRCKVTPLHVARGHGTGRGWLVELLRRLLGHWNVSKTEMPTLCGEGSGGAFHDYLANSLVCAIEEVREGGSSGKRYEVSDRIRSKLTEPSLELNLKYGGKGTRDVYTNFFFQTNHPDALVLTKEDRRINVMTGPDAPQPDAYYERLYGWLDGGGVAALHRELMSRDLAKFNWTRAPESRARTAMINGNRTETEILFHDLLAELPAKAMSFQQIVEAMEALSGEDAMNVSIDNRQVVKLLQHHARQGPRIRIGGDRKVRPWVFDESLGDDVDLIREEVLRTSPSVAN